MAASKAPSTSGPRRAIVAFLASTYGVFLAFVVFWPSPVDRPVRSLIDRVISELHERGVPAFVDYELIEFSANIALFVPVGLLMGLAVPVRLWPVAVIAGPLLSVGIEFAQGLLLEARYSTLADVVANSVGAFVGVTIAFVLRAAVAARDARVIERYRYMSAAAAASGAPREQARLYQ